MTLRALNSPVAIPTGPSGYTVLGNTTVLHDGSVLIGGGSGPNNNLYLEHLDPSGHKVGELFLTLPTVPGFGFTGSTVRSLVGGGFAVVYTFDNGNSDTELYARAYTAAGVATSDFVHVNAATAGQQSGAYLLATADGGFFIDFTDGAQSLTSLSPLITTSTPIESNFASEADDLHGRFFAVGGAATADTLLTPGSKIAPGSASGTYAAVAGEQQAGQSAQLANGSVVVPYFDTDFYTHTDGDGITRKDANNAVSVRLVTPGGASTTIRVNSTPLPNSSSTTVDQQGGTNAVALSNGGFAVVWKATSISGGVSYDNRFVRFFDSSGAATSGDINILQFPSTYESGVSLVALKNGGFAMAYETYSQANKHDVYVETVTASGAVDQTFAVATSGDDEILQDLSAAPDGSFYVTWNDLFSPGTGILTQHYGAPAAHDFNSDGTSDIALQSGGTIVDYILQNGTLLGGKLLASGVAGYNIVGTGDFNGDATSDVLLQNGGTLVDYLLQNGTLQSGNLIANGLGGYSVVGTGDFNGDGTTDILLQNGGTLVDYQMQNGMVQTGKVVAQGLGGYTVVGTGDFNNDGTTDILLQSGGTLVDYQMSNGGVQTGKVIAQGLTGYSVVGTGDFNADGTTDILLQNGGTLVDYLISNGSVASGNLIAQGLTGYSVAGTGDFNADGFSDILLRNGGTLVDYLLGPSGLQGGQLVATGLDGYAITSR